MIRYSKQQKDKVLVEYSDIMSGLRHAWKENNQRMIQLFSDAFQQENPEVEEIDHDTYRLFSYDSSIIQYLLKNELVINYDQLITRNNLKDALIRSYYEFNHDMKYKLTSYFRRFIDNEVVGKSNEVLIQEILNDQKVLQYIKKYENFDHYMEVKIERKLEEENNFEIEKKKNKVA